MKKIQVTGISLIIALLTGCMSAPSMPAITEAPPAGFEWLPSHPAQAYMLLPKGWYSQEMQIGNSYAICVSKEDVTKTGSFETGATLQLYKNTQRNNGVPPDVIAIKLVEAIQNNKVNTIIVSDDEMSEKNGIKRCVIRYKNHPAVAKPIVVHKLLVADNVHGHLYVLSFESSEETWEESWENIGNPIFTNLFIYGLVKN